jgi:hypothetical protein
MKGCAIYQVNQKWFDFYCAIWKILHRLWAALRNIASVSLYLSKGRAANFFASE